MMLYHNAGGNARGYYAIAIPSQVEEKNNRIQEILTDLGSEEAFFRPKWLDGEQPDEVFNVSVVWSERNDV